LKTNKKTTESLHEVSTLLLAAGLGTRLKPLTFIWPKCLMPIGGLPLLEHWLSTLYKAGIRQVLVNLHHHAKELQMFLERPRFINWVDTVYESELLGTAGTLRENQEFFQAKTILLVHSDNWCQCDFNDFLDFHKNRRPDKCIITMMTFKSPTPQTCGIVETDEKGVVQALHEKVAEPPGIIANGAVYLLEPEVIEWLGNQTLISDFSTEVLPNFIGQIATWHNDGIHRDIGELHMLKLAQSEPIPNSLWPKTDSWQQKFLQHPIHHQI